jgi:hypothetical protein
MGRYEADYDEYIDVLPHAPERAQHDHADRAETAQGNPHGMTFDSRERADLDAALTLLADAHRSRGRNQDADRVEDLRLRIDSASEEQ